MISKHSIPSGARGLSFYVLKSRINSTLTGDELTNVNGIELLVPKVVTFPNSKISYSISTFGIIDVAENGRLMIFPPLI